MNDKMRLSELQDALAKLEETHMPTAFTNVDSVRANRGCSFPAITLEGVDHLREIELERELKELDQELGEKEAEIEELEFSLDGLRAELRDAKHQIEVLETEVDMLRIENRNLKA